jgi:hypothetical protein
MDEYDSLLDDQFVEHTEGEIFKADEIDRTMYMTLPCPNCGEDLEVHVHAMVHIEK